jgi:Sec-independent protein translocase protein TatA
MMWVLLLLLLLMMMRMLLLLGPTKLVQCIKALRAALLDILDMRPVDALFRLALWL